MFIWKIAWRNLFRHKGKSFVIGTILFIGAFLMTLGNAIIESSRRGLEENMVNRFLGHLVIVSANEKQQDIVFAKGKTLQVIPNYSALKEVLEKQEYIESFLPLLRGEAMALHEEGKPEHMQALGVEFEDYQRMFHNNVIPVEGELLKPGERGILIGEEFQQELYESQKFWALPENVPLDRDRLPPEAREAADNNTLQIKHDLVILSISVNSFDADIRIPIKGIVRFQSLNEIWSGGVTFMDIESYRECFGHITAADNSIEISDEEMAIVLEEGALDDLFSESELVEEVDVTAPSYDVEAIQQQTQRTETEIDLDQGAYSAVFLKVQPGMSLEKSRARLQQAIKDAKISAKVLTWKEAVGGWIQLASIMQAGLTVFVLLIFFMAILIIVNTLSMAAMERASEIGMMRAVGARKGFISKMFFAETSSLSFIFGGLGIVTGVIIVWGLAALDISVEGSGMLNLLLGSDTFHPMVTMMSIALGIVELATVTLLALFYPMAVARKITPLDAIARD